MSTRYMLGTPLEEAVAEKLHNTCVPDHATFTYSGRPIAERMAFIRQARAVIPLIQRWRGPAEHGPDVVMVARPGR